MLAGAFRFVCSNGLVCGDMVADVRIPHKGDITGQVIEGAYEVLDGFGLFIIKGGRPVFIKLVVAKNKI